MGRRGPRAEGACRPARPAAPAGSPAAGSARLGAPSGRRGRWGSAGSALPPPSPRSGSQTRSLRPSPCGGGRGSGLGAARARGSRPRLPAEALRFRPHVCLSRHRRILQCHGAAHRSLCPARTTRALRRAPRGQPETPFSTVPLPSTPFPARTHTGWFADILGWGRCGDQARAALRPAPAAGLSVDWVGVAGEEGRTPPNPASTVWTGPEAPRGGAHTPEAGALDQPAGASRAGSARKSPAETGPGRARLLPWRRRGDP